MKVIKWLTVFIVFFVKLSVAQVSKTLNTEFMPSDGGVLYKIYNPSKNPKIIEGDFLMMSGNQIDPEGKVTFSTSKINRPVFLYCKSPEYKGDMYTVLPLLGEGDSATIKLNLDTLIKNGAIKPETYSESISNYMTLNLKIEKVISRGKLSEEDFDEKVQSLIENESENAKNSELHNIQRYIQNQNISPLKTPSGLYYRVHKQGLGIKAKAGDTVVVNYTGRYLSGAVFDTSIEMIDHIEGTYNKDRYYAPLVMSAGSGNFISGFDESLLLFPEGSIYTIILPSQLAFGAKGDANFPPYTPLIFEIELIEIRPRKLN